MARPTLEWREAVRSDLLEIVSHIAEDNVDAALALLDDIEAKVAPLVDRPKIYQAGRVVGTREMLIRKSYIVVYAESAEAVMVLRSAVVCEIIGLNKLHLNLIKHSI